MIIQAGVVATLFAMTIAFGAVDPAWLAGFEVIIFLLACIAALAAPRAALRPFTRTSLDLPVLLLVAGPAVQLVPLPSRLVTLVSPGIQQLRDQLGLPLDTWTTLSIYPFATWIGLHRIAAVAVLFFLVTRVVTTPRRMRAFLLALFVLGVFEAAYGLTTYLLADTHLLGIPRRAYADSVTGTLINRNHFAGLMELLLGVGFAYALGFAATPIGASGQERWRVALAFIGIMVMGVALLFSRSRAGIALGALVFLFGSLAMGREGSGRRLAAALALLILFCAAWIGLATVGERFAGDLAGETRSGRLVLWRDGLAMAMRFPVAGSGIGTWAVLFPAFKTMPEQITLSHAHNDYLEMLAEGGVLGLALLVFVLFRLFATLARAATRSSPRARGTLVALGAGLGSLTLHSLVDFNFQIPSNLFLFFAVAGVTVVIAEDPKAMFPDARAAGSRCSGPCA